ncbi:MAG: type II secretion system F family protein [Armatimonadota bacterium]
MNAADEQAVAQRLSTMGYALKAIVPASAYSKPARAAAVRQPKAQPEVPVSIEPSVRLRQLSGFYRQLATLVRAGMPLIQSLDELQNATKNRKLRKICGEMAAKVQVGASLSSSMAAYPRIFPSHTVGIIWSGELGGYLDVALDEAATEIETEVKDRLWGSVGWWVAKLNIFSLILLLPMWNMEKFLSEITMRTAGQSSGSEIGMVSPSQAVRSVAEVYNEGFIHISIPAFIIWIILAYGWGRLKKVPSVRRALDSALLLVPLWGPLHLAKARERFFKTLFKLYNASVAPAQAWAAASVTVRNSEIAQRLRRVADSFRQPNSSFYNTLASSNVFTTEEVNLVKTAETAGNVPEMLERIANYHTEAINGFKVRGRLIATSMLILPIIIVTGWMIIKAVAAYLRIGMRLGGLG